MRGVFRRQPRCARLRADLFAACARKRNLFPLTQSAMLDPSVSFAQPPFDGEEGREDQEKRPVVPNLVFGWAQVFGEDRAVDSLQVAAEPFRIDELAAGDFGDLAGQFEVGGGVFQLAVVFIHEKPGLVAADFLTVACGRWW